MVAQYRTRPAIGLALAFSIAATFSGGLRPAAAQALKSYRAALGESSVSGISSGAFMAVQFGVAWSSIVKGVGVVAGGPYYCAQAKASDFFNEYISPILTATGPCMNGPPPDLAPMLEAVTQKAAEAAIDPPDLVKRQKIYLFHGYNDAVVARSVTDAAERFYRTWLGNAASGNLFYQNALGAGHSFVVANRQDPELDSCADNKKPYIDRCGYDQAGIILQHIYGALNPPTPGPLGGTLKSFDQSHYTGSDIPGALSLSDKGYVFVPKSCEQGAGCRVHVALHGCLQDAGSIGKLFVRQSGYNAWADSNRIIVLYPQTESSPFLPLNPKACWDWWGYVTHDSSYVAKSGKQIAAIKSMLDALTANGAPAPVQSGAAVRLIVNDISDAAAALAWTPVAGASLYRLERAGADGQFQTVGETAGPSFGDRGLAPATAYAWRVRALFEGVEQAPSNVAKAATRPTPAPCAKPGSCP
ncbi:poly(3-hydroxybutyrate) depolymerase [uncultured Rhodoblastus sp.]|uniref:extracellular catalytic domain type 2 short-chain-length polyhydroxyalkanoate depolymerase n=1 Tax=uncultured Rhodoblastus sp. TaxID=543037 RepID=UPI0025CD889C|nr:poly(3-hydroxybutyrate) depolymerase [uncultured Rhodoblastus sp.]